MRRAAAALKLGVALALLASCFPHSRAPVLDRSLVEGRPDYYQVGRHDTLYSIAWRFNMDVAALASANGIRSPFVIQEGQRLRLASEPVAQRRPVRPPPAAKPEQAARSPTIPKPVERRENAPNQPTPRPPVVKPDPPPTSSVPAAEKPVAQARDSSAKLPAAKPAPRPRPRPSAKPAATLATVAPGGWRPPVTERPVRRFGGESKGFDYSLGPTTSIRAASGGIVVYAGPGLGGFRHLVIVKASDRYLVAYGVNVAPALREGESVLPGTVVAKIDSGGQTAGKFHFEIRDRGKPVDPGTLVGG